MDIFNYDHQTKNYCIFISKSSKPPLLLHHFACKITTRTIHWTLFALASDFLCAALNSGHIHPKRDGESNKRKATFCHEINSINVWFFVFSCSNEWEFTMKLHIKAIKRGKIKSCWGWFESDGLKVKVNVIELLEIHTLFMSFQKKFLLNFESSFKKAFSSFQDFCKT